MALTPAQCERYQRNTLIPGFGEAAQERLLSARVAIIGLGGLGSPVAYYLAAAGVGTLILIDSDAVELSNLQRQVLHRTGDIGRAKAASAAEKIAALNPDVRVEAVEARVDESTARDLFGRCDAVVEATDNFASKFLINDSCLTLRKAFATAGILALSGHALFCVPGESPCLRCLTPDVPEGVPSTAEQGVLGAVPGILGSVEAMEVIRYVAGLWQPKPGGAGMLHSVDGLSMRLRSTRIPRRQSCRCADLWST